MENETKVGVQQSLTKEELSEIYKKKYRKFVIGQLIMLVIMIALLVIYVFRARIF